MCMACREHDSSEKVRDLPQAGALLAQSGRQQSCRMHAASCHPWRSGSSCWGCIRHHVALIGGSEHNIEMSWLESSVIEAGLPRWSLSFQSKNQSTCVAALPRRLCRVIYGKLTSNETLSTFVLAARRRSEKERPSSNPPADKAWHSMRKMAGNTMISSSTTTYRGHFVRETLLRTWTPSLTIHRSSVGGHDGYGRR